VGTVQVDAMSRGEPCRVRVYVQVWSVVCRLEYDVLRSTAWCLCIFPKRIQNRACDYLQPALMCSGLISESQMPYLGKSGPSVPKSGSKDRPSTAIGR
jgi:hypothetical protein